MSLMQITKYIGMNYKLYTLIMDDIYMKIYKYGTYYNPATNHYGAVGSVNCDRCHRKLLDICIGWQTYDLCIECIQDINQHTHVFVAKNPLSNPLSNPTASVYPTSSPNEQFLTEMRQLQFRSNDSNEQNKDPKYCSYMIQSQFR
ncbi:MAG: hypothetical protein Homavirus2_6 [Homavirus sp.]|uniref:Uncharacterized protein n=1 Tax=Homavirus sp. TaxID=2487769 RepID=A0A3G5A4G3_9VIRU|nr:MAG: hypothetical protein Homavirus2_6 [Homavirus sp.]